MGEFNYLIGALNAEGTGQRPSYLALLRPANELDFTVDDKVLLQAVCQLWTRGRVKAREVQGLRQENERLKQRTRAGQLLGSSRVIEALRQAAARAATTRATLLMTGETGSGKEVVAKFIHENSPRRDGPFIARPFRTA
jgi:transcriptional regulator with PAS, ATPase and Fis domain